MTRLSRQINFFVTQEDMRALIHAILSDGETVAIDSDGGGVSPRIMSDSEINEIITLGLRCYLSPRSLVSHIAIMGLCATRTRFIDDERSPVIQLFAGGVKEKKLSRGRIYVILRDDVESSIDGMIADYFLKWTKMIFGSIKKSLIRSGYFYYGRDASAWIAKHHAIPDHGFSEYMSK